MFPSVELNFSSDSTDSESGDTRLSRRNLRDALNVLEIPEDRFVSNFRITKEMFKMLLDDVSGMLTASYRIPHILPTNALATFLRFLATKGYQTSIGNEWVSSMYSSQVSKVIDEYLNMYEEVLCPKWISLHNSLEEENVTKEAFYSRGGFPDVVGCVDGTHVRIKSPGKDLMHLYHNHKGFYSINIMTICDQNMVIKFVDARYPGRNHDASIWEQSTAHTYFREQFLKGKRNTWLLVTLQKLMYT